MPGKDVEIKFTGIRPGEKLFEELATDDEHADKTKHPNIFVGKFRPYEAESFDDCMLSDGADREAIKQAFRSLVPEYSGPRREGAQVDADSRSRSRQTGRQDRQLSCAATRMAIASPIARDAVAAGEGALSTCTMLGPSTM